MKYSASRLIRLWRSRAKYIYLLFPKWVRQLVPLIALNPPDDQNKEYSTELPEGYGPKRAVIRLSIPRMPEGREYSFCEHIRDDKTNDTLICTSAGGFAVSRDLGESWHSVNLWRHADVGFRNAHLLPNGELLLLATDPDNEGTPTGSNTLFVVTDLMGNVLHSEKRSGAGWHGSRGIDSSNGTIMYAEYTPNRALTKFNTAPHRPSRVWRSRDNGRSWTKVHEETGIRHFHLLQAHPDKPGEWWLASGDDEEESRIWKSTDDGETWRDQTDKFGDTVRIGDETFSRRLFRLTDLAFVGEEILWGCDDVLRRLIVEPRGKRENSAPASRVFRGNPSTGLPPANMGVCGPEVRSMVELRDFYVVITQSSHHFPGNEGPKVFLLRRDGAPGRDNLCHLFDVERHTNEGTGFTFSRASRTAKDGTFFTFRNRADVFNAPMHILKWQITFE